MGQVVGAAGRERAGVRSAHLRVRWSKVAIIATLILFACIFAAPFVWLAITALKDTSELNAFPIHWLPMRAQWGNFWSALTMIDYAKYTRNSLLLATVFSVLSTATSALVGFGFARLRGWGKGTLFMVMLSTTMLPYFITIIPTYMIFARLGLINSYWLWVIWGLSSSPFFSFLFRQFFAGIPLDLEDAAIVDGCNYWRIFWQIFLPLSKPVTATVAIFSFQWVWGDWFTPLIFLSVDNTTLSVAMTSGYTNPQGFILTNVLSAGVLYYTVPVLLLFFLAQRYFVQGIVTTGLKG